MYLKQDVRFIVHSADVMRALITTLSKFHVIPHARSDYHFDSRDKIIYHIEISKCGESHLRFYPDPLPEQLVLIPTLTEDNLHALNMMLNEEAFVEYIDFIYTEQSFKSKFRGPELNVNT